MKLSSINGLVNIKLILAIAVAIGAFCFGIFLLMKNTSPYVTIAEAKNNKNGITHISAEVIKETIQRDPSAQTLAFTLREPETGDTLPVIYKGSIPETFDSAPRIVVVGEYKDGLFIANEIQTKCPSKYEGAGKEVK